jgi:N-sulfoglucosamine sulfohydrolase
MQYNGYSFGIPGYNAWRDAWKRGELAPVHAQWFEPKASEELYRIADDPDNVRNLADNPAFASELTRHRAENDRHILAIRDSVFFPEGMTGREWSAYQVDDSYPLEELLELANAVSRRDPAELPRFRKAMTNDNKCVRYWGVSGGVVLGRKAALLKTDLIKRLDDSEPIIRLRAARALAGMGEHHRSIPVIREFLGDKSSELVLQAALAVDECNLFDADPSLAQDIRRLKPPYASRIADKWKAEGKIPNSR